VVVVVCCMGGSRDDGRRAKESPTAEAPTQVAVAQSDGIVFILVENRWAGQGSLGRGLGTPRAFWHVQSRSENHGRLWRATVGASGG
jgi:hypothetical protein